MPHTADTRRDHNDDQPLLLDPYSCGGGAAVGYHRAGFTVAGIDVIYGSDHYPSAYSEWLGDTFLTHTTAVSA
ncbi:hypothetical protein [Streptomyces avidinii]|uniref:DNA (Cytosine-5)-methyltransferase 1 n=1 Tax=Streptomyces avidinii TaxID=1895 RepID=A0ABS4LE15_STRAV|nr:hypothetical protein [Streptomyces avidinii]MBP2040245.1 hypothetical protein [Streptomyces avidinii]GGZ27165.1 hypothetical protein GCM10010343_63120 [Streptomyces avidinii]